MAYMKFALSLNYDVDGMPSVGDGYANLDSASESMLIHCMMMKGDLITRHVIELVTQ